MFSAVFQNIVMAALPPAAQVRLGRSSALLLFSCCVLLDIFDGIICIIGPVIEITQFGYFFGN